MKNDGVRTWRIAFFYLTLIAICLWIFYFYSVGKEKPVRQKEISVIFYHAGNDGWESLLEGMKQAEDIFSVNINYITLREDADGEEQKKAILKEIENGAEGIILAVCEKEEINYFLKSDDCRIPVVTVESGVGDSSVPFISADNFAMGKLLGEELLRDYPMGENLIIVLADDDRERDSIEERRKGLLEALEGKARVISPKEILEGEKADAAVGLHKTALRDITEDEEGLYQSMSIYGIGNTSSIVAALDRGKINKIVFQNEFNMGYLGVKALLNEINGSSSQTINEIEFYSVTRQELYGTQHEKLLFPIVE